MTSAHVRAWKRFLRRYLHGAQKRKKRLKDGSVVLVRPKRRYEKASRNDRFAGFVALREETVPRVIDAVIGSRVDNTSILDLEYAVISMFGKRR